MQLKTNGQTRTAADNTGLAKGGVSFSKDSFVIGENFVLRMNICGKNRQLLVAAKRYRQLKKNEI